jgi:hypothetical protein
MRLFIIASPLLALAACASNTAEQQSTAAAAPAASGVVVAAEDKVICHRVQGMGELHMHTECAKQSELDLRAQQALQDAGRAQQAAHMHSVPGSGG